MVLLLWFTEMAATGSRDACAASSQEASAAKEVEVDERGVDAAARKRRREGAPKAFVLAVDACRRWES